MSVETYQITVDRPFDASIGETKKYIKTALGSWGGGGDPADPLFHGLTVKAIHRRIVIDEKENQK